LTVELYAVFEVFHAVLEGAVGGFWPATHSVLDTTRTFKSQPWSHYNQADIIINHIAVIDNVSI